MNPTRIAFYGTLRAGAGMARAWFGLQSALHTDAKINGFELRTEGPFPYALSTGDSFDTGNQITVDVAEFSPEKFDYILPLLDQYEGFPRLYDRIVVDAFLAPNDVMQTAVKTWLYVPSGHMRPKVAGMARIPTGDWFDFAPRRTVMAR